MIKGKDNIIVIEGTKNDLMREFMCIAHTLVKKGVTNKEDIIMFTLLAVMPEKDLKKAIIETIDEMDDIGDALRLLNVLR